jgi:hypothetical protein
MPTAAHEQHPYQAPAECIRTARAGIAAVMHSLKTLSVDELEHLLVEAGTQLQSAATMLGDLECPGDINLRREVEQLRRELKMLALTLAESDRLVSGWARRIGATNAGYTEQGTATPLTLVKKVDVTG